jgi:hypothetical protein
MTPEPHQEGALIHTSYCTTLLLQHPQHKFIILVLSAYMWYTYMLACRGMISTASPPVLSVINRIYTHILHVYFSYIQLGTNST